jgi:hypothetical protein
MNDRTTGRLLTAVLVALLLFSCLFSCEKANNNLSAQSTVRIYLTDDPGAYREAWLDVQKVLVQVSTDSTASGASGTWVPSSSFTPGRYDLLAYRNGVDTAIAAASVPAGTVSRIQLVLGSNNTLVLDDGQTVTLHAPSEIYCEAKLIVNGDERTPGLSYDLVLDFDVARSIRQAGSGDSVDYSFVPYVRAFSKEAGASIEGWVVPAEAHPYVLATGDALDTVTAVPDANGYYKFWGIPSGTYTLHFVPDAATGYQASVLTGITASAGEVFTADTVRLAR